MTELPDGWAMAKLAEISSDAAQHIPAQDELFTYIDIGSIDRETKRVATPQVLLGKDAPSRARKKVVKGDTLVSMTRPNLNAVAQVPAELDGQIASTGFDVLRPLNGIDPRWLSYLVRTEDFVSTMTDLVQGALYPAVRSKDIRSYEAPIAPAKEQTRIADQLDTLLDRVNACNDHLDAIPGILKRFRQAVLTAALTSDLLDEFDDLSAKATRETAKISDIASVGTGSTPLRSNSGFYANAGTPWVTSAATGSPFVLDADQFVTDAAIAAHRLKVYPKGTLLVAMYGEGKTRGQVSELAIDATINQACAAISVDETLATRQFVKLALTANYLVMRELAEGGNQPNLNLSKIKEFEIPLPALDEQARIVGEVEGLLKLADRVEARYTAMRAHAQRLAPQVLAKAFRGELVEQYPQDEPASVLLQRLAATPSAKAPSSRGRPRAQPQVPATLPAPQAPAPIDWHTLPNNEWAAPAAAQDQAITACLTAVLKAWGQPMPELEARLATLLCQQSRVFTAVLPTAQAKEWMRLVGDEAKPLPAQVARLQTASNSPWGQAIKRMRARGDLVEAGGGDDTTWSLGPGASAIVTAGWPDGRAAFVVAYLRAHGVASILPALAPADQAFVHVRAA